MTIQAYFTHIKNLTDEYVQTDVVLDIQVQFDIRPGNQGYVNGSVLFSDDSVFYFKEYVDVLEDAVDKLMYSYHYQDKSHHLIFRYDNALHKPALAFRDHKHVPPDRIQEAAIPSFEDVFAEIFALKGWL